MTKVYEATKRVSKPLRSLLELTLATHDRYKTAYLWTPKGNAGDRRQNERLFPIYDYDIVAPAGTIKVRPYYSESCKNIYYSLSIYVNDEKKDIRALKTLLKA